MNTVFQDYALFPHMTVGENVEYGLKVKGVRRNERAERVAQALRTVQLAGTTRASRRSSRAASASGSRWRGRSSTIRASCSWTSRSGALDLKLRQEMQIELKRIQQEVGITFVYVTHDQEEALTMSDRIAVFRTAASTRSAPRSRSTSTPPASSSPGSSGSPTFSSGTGADSPYGPRSSASSSRGRSRLAGTTPRPGVVSAVVYVGSVTRFVVDLDAGGTLTAVRQNVGLVDRSSSIVEWQRVLLAWRPENTFTIDSSNLEEGR